MITFDQFADEFVAAFELGAEPELIMKSMSYQLRVRFPRHTIFEIVRWAKDACVKRGIGDQKRMDVAELAHYLNLLDRSERNYRSYEIQEVNRARQRCRARERKHRGDEALKHDAVNRMKSQNAKRRLDFWLDKVPLDVATAQVHWEQRHIIYRVCVAGVPMTRAAENFGLVGERGRQMFFKAKRELEQNKKSPVEMYMQRGSVIL